MIQSRSWAERLVQGLLICTVAKIGRKDRPRTAVRNSTLVGAQNLIMGKRVPTHSRFVRDGKLSPTGGGGGVFFNSQR